MNSIEAYFAIESGPCFILGNGPSLNNYDLSLLNPNNSITMNRSWKVLPGAKYHCNTMDITSVQNTPQNIIFLGPEEDAVGASVLRKIKCPVILVQMGTVKPSRLRPKRLKLSIPSRLDLRNGWSQSHCGVFALACAWWLGYNPIFLLGYDGYGYHYITDRYKLIGRLPPHELQTRQYRQYAKLLEGEVEVYNCNKDNVYEVHPYMSFDEALGM